MKHAITVLILACMCMLHADAAPVLGVKPAACAEGRGVVVERVEQGTPAALSGIREGDVLLALDGAEVSAETLPQMLSTRRAGETVQISVRRGDEEVQLGVCLAARASAVPVPATAEPALQQELRTAKQRIRVQLARLGAGADVAELNAAFADLQKAAAALVGGGDSTLVLYDAQGSVHIGRVDGILRVSLYDKENNRQVSAPVADDGSAPAAVVTRCRTLVTVQHHSRAERSGMRPGDTVLSVAGQPAGDEEALKLMLETAPAGAELRVWRVDHPVTLGLAPKAADHPRPSLKVDWDAMEEKELRDEELRGDMLEELRREHPDPAVLLRGLEAMDTESITFFSRDCSVTLFARNGRAYLRVTDDELSSLYEIGAPGTQNELPKELHPILSELGNLP